MIAQSSGSLITVNCSTHSANKASLTYIQTNSYSALLNETCRKETIRVRSTTVLLVRKDAHVALAGDGQVTLGETIMKASAKKVRRLYNDQILAGFAGATGDAFSLLTRFESKLEQYHGNLERAAIELSKEWRTDKMSAASGGVAGCRR